MALDLCWNFVYAHILWTNWWILIKFCKCIDIDGKDNYKLFFFNFQRSYGPWLMSEFCFHLTCLKSWEQIDGFWWNFVYAVLWLAHEIFLNISTELWPLIDVKIPSFRNNDCILIKFCLCIDIYDPCCDKYTLFSRTFQQSYDPWLILELCLCSISCEIIGGFDQIW